MKHLVLPMQIL